MTRRPRTSTIHRIVCLLIAASGVALATTASATGAQRLSADAVRASHLGPATRLHYTPNHNFDRHGAYLPAAAGFNLADVSSRRQLRSLPTRTKGLVFLGLCGGADPAFVHRVRPFVGMRKLYGFYLVDEPDPPSRTSRGCRAANLKAESDWIHAHVPGAITFIVLDYVGTARKPNYRHAYTPANSHIDLFGIDPYPCRRHPSGCHDSIIGAAVRAVKKSGVRQRQIVPVYQAFGGGGYAHWTLPTPKQERAMLATWRRLVPHPSFDFAYSWGRQSRDHALIDTPKLRAVFARHNN